MRRRIEQLTEFSFSDWRIFIQSLFLLPAVAVILKLSSLKKTQQLLDRYAAPPQDQTKDNAQQLQEARDIARIVNISARHGQYKANCLKQVLALRVILNKKKIRTTLHIGVKKNPDTPLEAHSWLECGGIPLIDSAKNLENFSSIHSSK